MVDENDRIVDAVAPKVGDADMAVDSRSSAEDGMLLGAVAVGDSYHICHRGDDRHLRRQRYGYRYC